MELSLISDTLTTIAATTHRFQIHSIIAPPTLKPRTAPKKLARKRCRIKRSSKTGDNGGPYDGEGFFDGGDGPFGGGGGGGGGGDNYGGGDGFNWDESVPVGPTDPAFDFVYEVLCWIVLSNCLHFAFKKVFRIVSDSEREKVVSPRFIPIC